MLGVSWRIRDEHQRANMIQHAANLPIPFDCQFQEPSDDRTIDQNACINAIYREIAKQKGDETFEDIRRMCKLFFGVPILRRDDTGFRDLYDTKVKHDFTHEEKLQLMGILDVSSKMTKKQGTEYIDAILDYWTEKGLALADPRQL